MMNRVFKIGDVSGENRIYQCSRYGNLYAFCRGGFFRVRGVRGEKAGVEAKERADYPYKERCCGN